MVKITENKLKPKAKIKGIKDYQNMSNKKLLCTLYKLKRITKNLLKNEYNKIVKMQNLSLNELKQIAKIRHIKNYNDMSKEDLIIALLKCNKSHAELRKSEDSNTEIGETKKLFNELRNNFSIEEIKRIRRKFLC